MPLLDEVEPLKQARGAWTGPNEKFTALIKQLGTLTIQEVRLVSSLAGTTATLYWSTGAVNLLLECAVRLEAPVTWQSVTNGIIVSSTNISYTVFPRHRAALALLPAAAALSLG